MTLAASGPKRSAGGGLLERGVRPQTTLLLDTGVPGVDCTISQVSRTVSAAAGSPGRTSRTTRRSGRPAGKAGPSDCG